uniref:Uncharacterized protein n=1 Tax=Tetranychus urticae TaxID=32264 RepID=T1K6G3_TETUR
MDANWIKFLKENREIKNMHEAMECPSESLIT